MQRTIKTFLCAALLALGWQSAWGFALLGPLSPLGGDSWETPSIGYELGGDIGTPKNIGQGYRRNIPVMYYAYDENFSGFFGVQGEQAVDSAMAIMNNTFTNNSRMSLDGYSSNLVEFPFDSQSFNYTAEELGLTDLKSVTLGAMVEQMGLAEPERYTWTLHDRYLPPGGTCPIDMEYLVVQRNYGIVPSPLTQTQYSPYVNNTLYTYDIDELCNPPLPPDAVAVPIAVDPYAQTYTAVAGNLDGLGVIHVNNAWAAPIIGGFYNGLTRDDVGGLRYLMTSNNIVYEDPAPTSQLEATNFSTLNLLITSDASALLQFAQTNPPAVVQAAFPNIVIDSVSNYFTIVTNPIIVSYYTNYIGGVPVTELIVATNGYTYTPQTNYAYTFGNVVYAHYSSNTIEQLQTINVGTPIGGVPGALVTNVTSKTIVLTNVPSGDYYIVPPGSCGYDIVSALRTNNFAGATTNVITAATNITTTGFFSESVVTYFTNNWYQYYACNFQTNAPGFYQGIGKIQFVRVADTDLDPLTEVFYTPVTNTYSMVWYNPTNSQIGTRTFQRIVTTPDFLFSAQDLTSPSGDAEIGAAFFARTNNYDTANILPGLAGPGTIIPSTRIVFNDVGDLFGNGSLAFDEVSTNGFLSQINQAGLHAWASFDGTTNAPIVYPNGTSIQELENQLIISITPTSLPEGTNGVTYPTTAFSATGGQPPYTWSLNGTQLPAGLSFYNGVLSGTPVGNSSGAYGFTIQLTDADNRVVDLDYSITIY